MSDTESSAEQELESGELRVSPLELFFDLVFVFTLTQLTELLVHDLTFATAGRVLLIFVILYWMYAGYAYLTNQVPPDRITRRLLLILGMWAFLICALAIPTALGDGGVVFGLGYLLVVLVHGGLYWQTHGRSVWWFVSMNLLAAVLVIVAGLLRGYAADALWLAAIAVHLVVTPYLSRFASRLAGDSAPKVSTEMRVPHFVERHGLLLIVAFGESVVAIGFGLAGELLDLSLIVMALLGVVLASALWWAFFARDSRLSEEALVRAPSERRFRLALTSYFYAYIPMLLGVVVVAAGVHESIGHLGDSLHAGSALALAGGVALYLAGNAVFRLVLSIPGAVSRALAAAFALVTAFLGMAVSAGTQLVALVVVLVTMLAMDERLAARHTGAV